MLSYFFMTSLLCLTLSQLGLGRQYKSALFSIAPTPITPGSPNPRSSSSLILGVPILLRGLSEIAGRYDAVLVDQFGVLHDGTKPIPGAIQVMNKLRELGKPVVIVSNTSKRKDYVRALLRSLGFGEVDDVACSGELAWHYIAENLSGKRCCWLTWSDEKRVTEAWTKGLNITLASAQQSDFILLHGTEAIVTSDSEKGHPISVFSSGRISEEVDEILKIAVSRSIPVICANQDFTAVQSNGMLAYMPGLLLNRYVELGGMNLISFGKPERSFFLKAIELAALSPKLLHSKKMRVIHIGDSIHHDIAGAHAAGIESLMITRHGVHRMDLHDQVHGSGVLLRPEEEEWPKKQMFLRSVLDLYNREGVKTPDYILQELTW